MGLVCAIGVATAASRCLVAWEHESATLAKESTQNRFLRFYCVGTLRVPRIFPTFHSFSLRSTHDNGCTPAPHEKVRLCGLSQSLGAGGALSRSALHAPQHDCQHRKEDRPGDHQRDRVAARQVPHDVRCELLAAVPRGSGKRLRPVRGDCSAWMHTVVGWLGSGKSAGRSNWNVRALLRRTEGVRRSIVSDRQGARHRALKVMGDRT